MIAALTSPLRRPTSTSRRRWPAVALALAVLVLGACGVGEGPELVAFAPSATPVPTPTPTVEPTPTPEPTATPEVLPEVEEREPVPMWRVVDDIDTLNMRAEPTTAAEIIATFGAGDSGLVGTGQTATADGFEWIEIAAGEERPAGWVAAKFLVADEPAAAPERVCFHSEGDDQMTTLALDFAADAETFTGGVRLVTGTDIEYQAVGGRRVDGTVFTVAVQRLGVGQDRTEEWSSGPAGIVLGDGSAVDAAECADIGGEVNSINVNVTSFPDPPA